MEAEYKRRVDIFEDPSYDKAKYKNLWYTGPEMQVLDNEGHSDGKIVKHRAGNLYDLIAGPDDAVKPVGEWNKAEIIVEKGTLVLKLTLVVTVVKAVLFIL